MLKIIKNLIKTINPSARDDLNKAVRLVARTQATRKYLNFFYGFLSIKGKGWFYKNFAKIFRDIDQEIEEGYWKIWFGGKPLKLPFTGNSTWLEWDSALSILGHDVEVSAAYEHLIKSKNKPKCFFDIGASYGLHSSLFAMHGIKTVLFEPISDCHKYFQQICNLNQLEANIQGVALGDKEDEVDFWYPKTETWLGTASKEIRDRLKGSHELIQTRVRQVVLDTFVKKSTLQPDLIKIDVEGSLLNVLQGAVVTLRTYCPMVVFESHVEERRKDIYRYFSEVKYVMTSLKSNNVNLEIQK